MFKPIKTLLFATNLLENCRPALEASISLATQYQATLILLHVISRDVPAQTEEHFKSLLGEEKWRAFTQEQEDDAREALIGKMSSEKIGKKILRQYCVEAGIEPDNCDFPWKEFIVIERNKAIAIVNQAMQHNTDLIVLGAEKSFWGGNSVGSTIKGVMQKSKIPVLVLPPRTDNS